MVTKRSSCIISSLQSSFSIQDAAEAVRAAEAAEAAEALRSGTNIAQTREFADSLLRSG